MTLEHLDLALGFAVIMLLLSLLITVAVQMVVAVLGLRGRNLRWGVEQILGQIDKDLKPHAQDIAERALRHPAIAPIWKRKATAIRAAELIRVLDGVRDPSTEWSDPEAGKALATVLDQVIHDSTGLTSRKIVRDVNTWFDTIMDRATERFVLHTRWATAALALVFTLALHVDSVELLERLSKNSDLRTQLVAASEGTLRKAEDVVALTAERKAVASTAIAMALDDPRAAPAAAVVGAIPPSLVTREQGEAWLRERLENLTGADSILRDPVMDAYQRSFDETTRVWLGELRASTAAINQQLREATFQLIPDPYPSITRYWEHPRHLVGTLISALLLSLGAPFWFNVLRQLATLRPVIAQKVALGEGGKQGDT